jgi:hypothetical protein
VACGWFSISCYFGALALHGFLNVVGMGLAGPGEAVHQHLAVGVLRLGGAYLLHLEWCESIRSWKCLPHPDAGGPGNW